MNIKKRVAIATFSLAFSSQLLAAGAADMVAKVETVTTANQEALWGIGAVVIVIAAIAMMISKMKGQTR